MVTKRKERWGTDKGQRKPRAIKTEYTGLTTTEEVR